MNKNIVPVLLVAWSVLVGLLYCHHALVEKVATRLVF